MVDFGGDFASDFDIGTTVKTLIDGVNELLKRVNVNAGDAVALSSLVDSTRQHNIDVAIQVINEGVDELYSRSNISLPGGQAESTITLVTNIREYDLASNLITLLWPFIDRTNTQYLNEFPGGYNAMLLFDPQQLFTGLPFFGSISPITSKLRVDRSPTSLENGKTYTYEYEKDLGMALATDPMPFNNETFRAMVPAWVQMYKREIRNEFDAELWKQAMGRASRSVTEQSQRTSYSPKAGSQYNSYDWPFR